MKKEAKLEILNISKRLHSQVEASYLNDSARKGDDKWLEKQRILLADMALHLLQTAINPDEIKLDLLRNNIHSILTISDQFLPKAGFKATIKKLHENY